VIIVLFFAAVAASNRFGGAVGASWWRNFGHGGELIVHNGTGTLVGLLGGGVVVLVIAGCLGRSWRWRRLVGAIAVSAGVVSLAAFGWNGALTCAALLALAAGCARGPRAANDVSLVLLGLILGGSRVLSSLVAGATGGATSRGEIKLEKAGIFLVIATVMLGTLVVVVRRSGIFGDGSLKTLWKRWFGSRSIWAKGGDAKKPEGWGVRRGPRNR
jgi:hypothetical protein